MSAERPGASHTIALTIVISTLTTLVIGSMLYYTLKRHDLAHTQEFEQLAAQLSAQRAVAASQIFAAVSRSVIQSDIARVQELVDAALGTEGLIDVMIVSKDNMVLAAKNTAQVGQRLQDSTWLSWKGQHREVAQRAVDQAGQPVFVLVEPLKEKGDTFAWAMLVFALPNTIAALRPPMERLLETGRLMAPILLFLLISIGLAMRLATTAIRKQIQGVMASVLEEPAKPDEDDWLRKAG